MTATFLRFFVVILIVGAAATVILRFIPMKHTEMRCIAPDTADQVQRLITEYDIGPLHVQGHATVPGRVADIFPHLIDIDLMKKWMPELQSGAYDGVAKWEDIQPGEIRKLSFGAQADVERILLMDAPFHFAYQIIGGIKIDRHLAFMTVRQKTPGQTTFSWFQFFEAQGVKGRFQKWQVRRFVRSGVAGFANEFKGAAIESCH